MLCISWQQQHDDLTCRTLINYFYLLLLLDHSHQSWAAQHGSGLPLAVAQSRTTSSFDRQRIASGAGPLSRMRRWRTDLRPSPIQIHSPEGYLKVIYWPTARDPTGLRWQQFAPAQGPAYLRAQGADTCSIGCYFLNCGPVHAGTPEPPPACPGQRLAQH